MITEQNIGDTSYTGEAEWFNRMAATDEGAARKKSSTLQMDDFSVNFFIDVLIINNIKYNAFQLACAFQSATIVYFSYAPFSVFL